MKESNKVEQCRQYLEEYALRTSDKMKILRGNIRLKLKEIEDILKESEFLKMIREMLSKEYVYESFGDKTLEIFKRFALNLSYLPELHIYNQRKELNILSFFINKQEMRISIVDNARSHFEYLTKEKEKLDGQLHYYKEDNLIRIDNSLTDFLKLFKEENILDEIRQFLTDYLDNKIKEYDKEVIQSI